jgi:CheY-like chemotaxis protein
MPKPSALLIEDDTVLSMLFSEALGWDIDLEIELIYDGQSAVDRLNGAPVDIVIMDLHLPNISGKEILDQIRRNPQWNQTKVLVMSADVFAIEDIQDKADLTIVKPIDLSEFRQLVAQLIG